jgi:hypothetical protein
VRRGGDRQLGSLTASAVTAVIVAVIAIAGVTAYIAGVTAG